MVTNDESHMKGPLLSDSWNTSKSESRIKLEHDVKHRTKGHSSRLVLLLNLCLVKF